MRTALQIKQRCATIARLVREAEARIASVSASPTPQEKRRATMARKVLRRCAAELSCLHVDRLRPATVGPIAGKTDNAP